MSRVAVVVAALATLAAAGCGGGTRTTTVTVTRTRTRTRTVTATVTRTSPSAGVAGGCTGSDLTGTFTTVPGSAGAGHVSYALRLTNASSGSCVVSGLPVVQLLDAKGDALSTNVSAAQPGAQTGVRVDLAPGQTATAEARFSPDVPGTGEQTAGPCEPTATTLRVTAPGGGAVDAPIRPPTSVCEHGAMQFGLLARAS